MNFAIDTDKNQEITDDSYLDINIDNTDVINEIEYNPNLDDSSSITILSDTVVSQSSSSLSTVSSDNSDSSDTSPTFVSSVAISSTQSSSTNNVAKPTTVSQESISNAALTVYNYVLSYNKLPNYVTIDGFKFSMNEYLYLLSRTIQYKYNNIVAKVTVKYDIKDPQNLRGSSIKGTYSPNHLNKYAIKVIKYIKKYNVAPNVISSFLGEIQYQTLIFLFSMALKDDSLPSYVSININKNNNLNKYVPTYTRAGSSVKTTLNNTDKSKAVKQYLKSTKNVQVSDKKIKRIAKIVTKGLKTRYQKAKAIYNWVRDKIDYKFYYNTKYGAKKTLTKRVGNCVDKSHLIVALCRASKIPARYVHGSCKFVASGSRIGHVWTQIKVGNKWIVADASHYELNGFGVVNNWDPSSYKLYGKYAQLNF